MDPDAFMFGIKAFGKNGKHIYGPHPSLSLVYDDDEGILQPQRSLRLDNRFKFKLDTVQFVFFAANDPNTVILQTFNKRLSRSSKRKDLYIIELESQEAATKFEEFLRTHGAKNLVRFDSEELADTQEKRNAAKANFDWWPESRGTNEPLETAYNE